MLLFGSYLMSNLSKEPYSIMFSSLKHPSRRKILRMLAEKPRNFSKIEEQLGISSSNLTYHLENLGELLTKMDDGSYKLSKLGEAAVITMKGVEESIKTRSGVGIRGAYDEVVNSLNKSHRALGRQIALQYSDRATDKKLADMLSRQQQNRFKGYEHMISAYFEALAQSIDKGQNTENSRQDK